jgi:glycosyltransferase involved in cell wall biosynthesis
LRVIVSERPIKIVQVIARLNIGGAAVQVILPSGLLGPPRFETMLVCGQVGPAEGDMGYLAEQKGVTPVVIPELGRELSPLRDSVTLLKLWRLLRRERPDVVHTHTAKAGFVGRVAARLAGVPVVVHTFHGHVFYGYFGPAKARLFIALERFCARLSNRLVAPGEDLKRELVGYRIAPAEKIAVVPYGLDLQPLANAPRRTGALRRELGLSDDARLVGVVGRLVPVKNLRLLLGAGARLKGAHFAIVGDGECRPDLEARAAALGLRDRVHFLSWRRDLPAIYSDLDALAISSRNEGTPVSIIEAMAAGVPVVSTAVGGVPDLIEDGRTGLLVPPEDAPALADALDRLLRDQDFAHTLAETARPLALERFGVERLADDLAALYVELLAEKSDSGLKLPVG